MDNFIVGDNEATLRALAAWLSFDPQYRILHLWGAAASGKTHLMQAHYRQIVNPEALLDAPQRDCLYLSKHSSLDDFDLAQEFDAVMIDGIETLSQAQQIAAFQVYNDIKTTPQKRWLSSSRAAPRQIVQLGVRDDLATRLSWGMVQGVQGLSDEAIKTVLFLHAQLLGFTLSPDVAHWMLWHLPRDAASQRDALDALDYYALQHKKPLTLHTVRAWYAQNNPSPSLI